METKLASPRGRDIGKTSLGRATVVESPLAPERDTELVLGIVAAVGTDLDQFEQELEGQLRKYNYQPKRVRLSGLIKKTNATPLAKLSECERINALMTQGNELRKKLGRNDALALYATVSIADQREEQRFRPRTAHILRQLKRPEEVVSLRNIYGPGFFLIGVYATESDRRECLKRRGITDPNALVALLKRDEEEDHPWGQRTRGTFHLADVFVRLRPSSRSDRLDQFFQLLFGSPFTTPTQEEYAMFLAYSSALRSGDLSRQVGAVVLNEHDDVIGVGANDVPCHGGGLCWPGDRDFRDHVKGYDSNDQARRELLRELIEQFARDLEGRARKTRLKPKSREYFLQEFNRVLDDFRKVDLANSPSFSKTQLFEITEYGRAVHAEMEALISCARTGANTMEGRLFTTTFPCHNCAKHIIAAGIREVIYVEPYAKSRAHRFYSDSIVLDDAGEEPPPCKDGPVRFRPFIGVGPRRFVDLFSMKLGSGYPIKREKDGVKANWDSGTASPRIPMTPASYLQRETLAEQWLREQAKE
jgi:deoxycytidylate deaminase